MTRLAPLLVFATLAAPASAQDYRVDVFAGTSITDALGFTPTTGVEAEFDLSSEVLYGLSIDRLDVFAPSLDIGLDYSSMAYEYSIAPMFGISGQSLLVTANYNVEVAPRFEVFGTAGLGVMRAEYTGGSGIGDFEDTQLAGMVGLGARYSFDAVPIFAKYRHQRMVDDTEFAFGVQPTAGQIQGDVFLIGAGVLF